MSVFDVCKFNILVVLIYSFNTQFYVDILDARKKEKKDEYLIVALWIWEQLKIIWSL